LRGHEEVHHGVTEGTEGEGGWVWVLREKNLRGMVVGLGEFVKFRRGQLFGMSGGVGEYVETDGK
jgi:hypothetical protein